MRTTLWNDPFLTIGALTLAELANAPDPDLLREPALDRAARELANLYLAPGFGRLLAGGYAFPNSGFAQPTWYNDPERYADQRNAYACLVLNAYQAQWPMDDILNALGRKKYGDVIIRGKGRSCAYTGEPADLMVDKRVIPLWNGKNVPNFTAPGDGGVPISGFVSLALHAAPLGCAFLPPGWLGGPKPKERGLAALVCSDMTIMRGIVRANLAANRKLAAGDSAAYDHIVSYHTWLIEQILPVLSNLRYARRLWRVPPATVLYWSNNNKSPFLHTECLSSGVLTFLSVAELQAGFQERIQAAWHSWEVPVRIPGKPKEMRVERVNHLFHGLFTLPEQAAGFWNHHIQPRSLPYDNSEMRETFMSLILRLPSNRLDVIQEIANRLTVYLKTTGDKGTYKRLDQTPTSYAQFSATLSAVGRKVATKTKKPLFSADEWQQAFVGSTTSLTNWVTARSLLLLHVTNRLAQEMPDFLESQTETSSSVERSKKRALKRKK